MGTFILIYWTCKWNFSGGLHIYKIYREEFEDEACIHVAVNLHTNDLYWSSDGIVSYKACKTPPNNLLCLKFLTCPDQANSVSSIFISKSFFSKPDSLLLLFSGLFPVDPHLSAKNSVWYSQNQVEWKDDFMNLTWHSYLYTDSPSLCLYITVWC